MKFVIRLRYSKERVKAIKDYNVVFWIDDDEFLKFGV